MGKYSGKPYSNFKSTGTSFEWLRFAEVTRVDYFRQELDIRYLDADNMVTRVPFISPGYYPGGSMGGMPEIGSIALVGYTKQTTESGYPIVLGFFRATYFSPTTWSRSTFRTTSTDTFASVFLKRRLKNWKLYPGEFLISSIDGSDLRVDKGIFLQNSAMNEINMDPHSQVISMLSHQSGHELESRSHELRLDSPKRSSQLCRIRSSTFNPLRSTSRTAGTILRVGINPPEHLNQEYGTHLARRPRASWATPSSG
jgi:hypothetical protein